MRRSPPRVRTGHAPGNEIWERGATAVGEARAANSGLKPLNLACEWMHVVVGMGAGCAHVYPTASPVASPLPFTAPSPPRAAPEAAGWWGGRGWGWAGGELGRGGHGGAGARARAGGVQACGHVVCVGGRVCGGVYLYVWARVLV